MKESSVTIRKHYGRTVKVFNHVAYHLTPSKKHFNQEFSYECVCSTAELNSKPLSFFYLPFCSLKMSHIVMKMLYIRALPTLFWEGVEIWLSAETTRALAAYGSNCSWCEVLDLYDYRNLYKPLCWYFLLLFSHFYIAIFIPAPSLPPAPPFPHLTPSLPTPPHHPPTSQKA